MKIIPVLTEKSLQLAKDGVYTFFVDNGSTKNDIKKAVESIFGVHVTKIKTINYKGGKRKNYRGLIRRSKAIRKAMVTLKEKEKIDLFEQKRK
jgi:large subunit ribosomal protein L23